MAALKTQITSQPVSDYLDILSDEALRKDCEAICKLMAEITQAEAKKWGSSIIGFGHCHYKYDSGTSNDWFIMGFSPRKTNISLYISGCEGEKRQEILSRLGKHKTGKSCIYIKELSAIHLDVLRELCELSYRTLSGVT